MGTNFGHQDGHCFWDRFGFENGPRSASQLHLGPLLGDLRWVSRRAFLNSNIRRGMIGHHASCQASAYFQWSNYLCSLDPLPPLFINMDETSLAYAYHSARGNVICRKNLPPGKRIRGQKAKLRDLRGHVTYMSFVCSDPSVQPYLPQILVGNEHFFTLTGLASARPCMPPNVHLWREKSAWNSIPLMRKAICELHKALYCNFTRWNRNVVLVLDTHRSHMHGSISVLARMYGFQIMYAWAPALFLEPSL